MVIMDRQDYINKVNQLLNQDTYKVITKDPTNTIKNKLTICSVLGRATARQPNIRKIPESSLYS